MKKRLFLLPLMLLGLALFQSCPITDTAQLLSIEFVNDHTLKYRFLPGIGRNVDGCKLDNCSITPDDGYWIYLGEYGTIGIGRAYFNKDIPDGVTVELDFCYAATGKHALTYTFVKGKESEGVES